jgi:hypothetical protein
MKFSAALVGAVLSASIAVADVDPIVKKVRPSLPCVWAIRVCQYLIPTIPCLSGLEILLQIQWYRIVNAHQILRARRRKANDHSASCAVLHISVCVHGEISFADRNTNQIHRVL